MTARLQSIGRHPENLSAVFLTHEHSDHVRGIGPFARKFKVPVYSTEGTHEKIKNGAGVISIWNHFRQDDRIDFGDLTVEPYPTPHDAAESVAFVVRSGDIKIGHAADLGSINPLVRDKLNRSHILLIEANHDVAMLETGPYTWPLKQRIKSDTGHLSNDACAELLASLDQDDLRMVILMHLSETNNHPDLAALTVKQALKNQKAQLHLAQQNRPTPLFEIQ